MSGACGVEECVVGEYCCLPNGVLGHVVEVNGEKLKGEGISLSTTYLKSIDIPATYTALAHPDSSRRRKA